MKLKLTPIIFACITAALALSDFVTSTQAASPQEASLGKATMRFDGTTLRVSTGVIERQWKVTKLGLATVALRDLATGRVWGEDAKSECDWFLPGLVAEGATAELKGITSKEGDDEGFTTKHLEVVSEWEYPAAGLQVRHVVWAYPGAAGLRTALELKRSGAGQGTASRQPGIGETLPVLLRGLQLRAVGYYADTQNRNTSATEILREEPLPSASASGSNDWASFLDLRAGQDGLILVKESHKCVTSPKGGANTGAFEWDARGLRSTGLGWYLGDVDGSRFHRCWANWVVLYHGGDDEMALALKQWDRVRYPIDPARDLYVMANTWGSGASQFAAREENVRAEIDSQAGLGIDVQQIDDGWQGLETHGDHWRPVPRITSGKKGKKVEPYDVYPNGWQPVRDYAAQKGVKLGLWANARISAEDLLWNYDQVAFRYFKIDFANLDTMAKVEELMGKVRGLVLHSGQQVRVNWDVTEKEPRAGYFFGREYGNIYLENRKPDSPKSVIYTPHLVLRDAWQVARYLNLNKFQVTVQNADRVNREMSDAWKHPHDYCLAQTLMGSPIFFQETHYYTDAARNQIRPLLALYKQQRDGMFKGYVFPVGDKPDNKNWSGFQNHNPDNGTGYLTLFRQIGNSDSKRAIALKFLPGRKLRLTDLVASQSRAVAVPADGRVEFTVPQAPGFLFLKYEPASSSNQ